MTTACNHFMSPLAWTSGFGVGVKAVREAVTLVVQGFAVPL